MRTFASCHTSQLTRTNSQATGTLDTTHLGLKKHQQLKLDLIYKFNLRVGAGVFYSEVTSLSLWLFHIVHFQRSVSSVSTETSHKWQH